MGAGGAGRRPPRGGARARRLPAAGTKRRLPAGSKTRVPGRKVGSAEEFSRQILEAGSDISGAVVQRALKLARVPLSASRRNVIPHGKEAVNGAVCGLYVFADSIGVTAWSRKNAWLTKLLAAFCRQKGPKGFPFTSIQVNINYAARPHVDRNNLGKSLIIGLGGYQGGSLWVHDDQGGKDHTLAESLPLEPLYKKGATFPGVDVNIQNTWSELDGNRLHFTRPFRGTRYSLVYFTCDRYADAREEVRAELRSSGFPFRWNNPKLQRMLATKRVERAALAKRVFKVKHSKHKGIIPHLVDGDRLRYEPINPKLEGCNAWVRYEGYKRSRSFAEAKRLGSWPIDFIFDYNMGFMGIEVLQAAPASWKEEVRDPQHKRDASGTAAVRVSGSPTVKVRVCEMHPANPGLEVPRAAVSRLAAKVASLSRIPEDRWNQEDGPLAKVSLSTLRTLLLWAQTGALRFKPSQKEDLCGSLAAWGEDRLVGLLSPQRSSAAPVGASAAPAGSRPSSKVAAAPAARGAKRKR